MTDTNSISSLAHEVNAKEAAWPVLPIIMADMKTGIVIYASNFVADIFGYTVQEIEGNVVEMLLPEAVRIPHALWRQDARVPKTRLMGLGRQILGRRKNGALFPVHVGLTAMESLDKQIGIAFVVDLTGIVLPITDTTLTQKT